MARIFETEELEKFVKDHIQQKIDNSELHLMGFNMENADDFKREFEIYRTALLEGIINGIFLCGCEINGIK